MENRNDIFDRIMTNGAFSKFAPFYKKHKAVLLYLFFGGLTTLVSIGAFALFLPVMDALVANILSWIFAVSFAYITNRIWVFSSQARGTQALGQMIAFYGGRLVTLAFEESAIYIFVWLLYFPPLPVKILAQVMVLVLNFFISKFFVFRKKEKSR